MPPSRSVSVVVPVYRGQATLAELVDRLTAVLPSIAFASEIILVDDGSDDGSWREVERLALSSPNIRGIELMRNYGQHNATLAGVQAARHEFIVTLDDDLQQPPESIPQLFARLDEGFDVVYGTPVAQRHGLWRDIASWLTKLALRAVMGADIAPAVGPFRVFRTQLRDAFAGYQSPFVSIDILLTWGTTRFGSVPVDHEERRAGTSSYTFARLVTHALNMVTGFGTLPLQIASLLGFAFTLFGIGVLVFVVVRYLIQGDAAPGFPFLASIIAIFSGVQLFALGIIGEYLGRMHFRITGQPAYLVRRQVSAEDASRPPASPAST